MERMRSLHVDWLVTPFVSTWEVEFLSYSRPQTVQDHGPFFIS